jgi:hypothetical protein
VLRPALFSERFQNLHQTQINLPALHVGSDDLYLHAATQPIHLLRVLAEEHVLLLDEPVVVVGHARDVHQALDKVLGQLDEQSELRHAGDEPFELIPDLAGHESHLLPLEQFAFGLVGPPFHFR